MNRVVKRGMNRGVSTGVKKSAPDLISAVYPGVLMHNRISPKKHQFSYRVASWVFDLDELEIIDRRYRLFSRNRFNLIAFYDADYGDGSGRPLKEQINNLLAQNEMAPASKLLLFCYPRVLGYVFNPLSVYFCFRNEELIAVVYEVSNTFGERHSYVVEAEDIKNKTTVIRQMANKQLHVSPFFPMDCHYRFRTAIPAENVMLSISLHKAPNDLRSHKIFAAVFKGSRVAVNDKTIFQLALSLPLQTIKVVAAIHWEALKIWLKGIRLYRHKPAEQPFSWSRGKSISLMKANKELS